uniref:Uncharacterized protein n=1 Tax=Triticum urartu TaxID=4572 RepID=A0A8R7PTI5_TRIUA
MMCILSWCLEAFSYNSGRHLQGVHSRFFQLQSPFSAPPKFCFRFSIQILKGILHSLSTGGSRWLRSNWNIRQHASVVDMNLISRYLIDLDLLHHSTFM